MCFNDITFTVFILANCHFSVINHFVDGVKMEKPHLFNIQPDVMSELYLFMIKTHLNFKIWVLRRNVNA